VWRTITAVWSSLNDPASNNAPTWGNPSSLRAAATSRRARAGDTPQRHTTQCSGERMPKPSHAPVRNASPISATNSAVTTFSRPTVSANRSSSGLMSFVPFVAVSVNDM